MEIAFKMECQPPTPDYIRGRINTEFPVREVHSTILGNFNFYSSNSLESSVAKIKCEIKKYKNNKCSEGITRVKFLNKMLTAFIEGGEREYLRRVEGILEKYNIKTSKKKVSLMELLKKDAPSADDELLEIIAEFLDVVEDYMVIDVTSEIKLKEVCPSCDIPVEDFEMPNENGIQTCACGFRRSALSGVSSASSSVNLSTYENRENFWKGMQRKQGKLHGKLPDDLFEKLDEFFFRKYNISREEILSSPTDKNGIKSRTSLQMMRGALSELGFSQCFIEIDYITHIYWEWTLIDFTHLEEQLMSMYDDTQREYDTLEDRQRQASLNLQWRLYHQLRGLGFVVSEERFLFQDSEKSRIFHREAWKKMCERSGWPYFCTY